MHSGSFFHFPLNPTLCADYPFLLVISVNKYPLQHGNSEGSRQKPGTDIEVVVTRRCHIRGSFTNYVDKLWLFLTTYPPPLTFCMAWTLTKSGHFWTTSSCKCSLWTTPYGVSLIYCNDWSGKNRLISIFGYSTRNRIICNLTPKWLWSFLWGAKTKNTFD